jgi:hypothetical protein
MMMMMVMMTGIKPQAYENLPLTFEMVCFLWIFISVSRVPKVFFATKEFLLSADY